MGRRGVRKVRDSKNLMCSSIGSYFFVSVQSDFMCWSMQAVAGIFPNDNPKPTSAQLQQTSIFIVIEYESKIF